MPAWFPLVGSHVFFCCYLGVCAGNWATAFCSFLSCFSSFPTLCPPHTISSSSDSAYTQPGQPAASLFLLFSMYCSIYMLCTASFIIEHLGLDLLLLSQKPLGEKMSWFPLSLPLRTLKQSFELHLLINLIPLGTWANKGQMDVGKEKLPFTFLVFVTGPEN